MLLPRSQHDFVKLTRSFDSGLEWVSYRTVSGPYIAIYARVCILTRVVIGI